MISPAFIEWAKRQLKPILAHREARKEARQRQKRFARMLRVNPQLRLAHERLERDRKRHATSRGDLLAMRAAVHSQLGGSHG